MLNTLEPKSDPSFALRGTADAASSAHLRALSHKQYAVVATGLALLGLSTIWSSLYALWSMWTTDAMKSIGMAVPPVSLFLILRVWKRLNWSANGTWWGLALVVLAAAMVRIEERSILILVISPHWSTVLPPHSLALLLYASGAVLLFGGVTLYRAALFPILLLWFANPIPRAFNLLVDFPLQTISATLARSLAMALGHTLTPDHLRLMFTPEFGMFIAPGCDGIRGAITMGFIACIAGYLYKFRWSTNALVVAGAVLLGYAFNLVRLCLLVFYYVAALHVTWLQDKAETADYLVGAALFLFATLLLFAVIHRLRDAQPASPNQAGLPEHAEPSHPLRMQYAHLSTMAVIAIVGCVGMAHAINQLNAPGESAHRHFPQQLGNYTLVRTWNETLTTGPVVYNWALYAPADGSSPVSIGISPVLGWHDPLICHSVRGEHPSWEGPLSIAAADHVPVEFSSAFYANEIAQYLEASTQCVGSSCSEFATGRTHLGFVYSRPNPHSLLANDTTRTLPVLIRIETADVSTPVETARQTLTNDLRSFLANVQVANLTAAYSN